MRARQKLGGFSVHAQKGEGKGLYEWRDRLSSIVDSGIKRGEIRRGVDAKEVATLIISSLEGALVIGRLERNREALVTAQSHLERYLENEVRLSRQ